MTKILDFLQRKFYSSYLGLIYFNILLWIDRKKFEREIKNRPSDIAYKISYNQIKQSYNEGLNKVKGEVAKLAGNRTKVEYENTLTRINELLTLANNENREEIEALKKIWLYKDQDIKTNTDKAKMVESRINDYKDLHKHIKERNQRRQERKKNNG